LISGGRATSQEACTCSTTCVSSNFTPYSDLPGPRSTTVPFLPLNAPRPDAPPSLTAHIPSGGMYAPRAKGSASAPTSGFGTFRRPRWRSWLRRLLIPQRSRRLWRWRPLRWLWLGWRLPLKEPIIRHCLLQLVGRSEIIERCHTPTDFALRDFFIFQISIDFDSYYVISENKIVLNSISLSPGSIWN